MDLRYYHLGFKVDEPPHSQRFCYDDEPVCSDTMEFRLIYDGRLPSQGRSNARVDVKQEIRRQFHTQLAQLWQEHPTLRRFSKLGGKEEIASHFTKFGFTFVPLINQKVGGSFAALEILFLRRDHPGNLIGETGDIDNRIKVLFDGMHVPKYATDLEPGAVPQEGETPFYCLLEDDSLITSVRVTTDRLLTAYTGSGDHPLNDTVLVVHVKTGILGWGNHAETFM